MSTESLKRAAIGAGYGDNPLSVSRSAGRRYSTVTVLARFRGWSTSQPRRTAMW
jgi:hypothetical protein